MNEPKEFMDLEEAAKYIGMHPNTLSRYAAAGDIPATKVGRRWQFSKTLLDDFRRKGMLENVKKDK